MVYSSNGTGFFPWRVPDFSPIFRTVYRYLYSAPTLVRISGLWSGSGLFWAKWSGFGPDFAQKSGFFTKLRKERWKRHILMCVDSINLSWNVAFKRLNWPKVRISLVFVKPVRKKDKIGSGFGLVFVKFWSGFSPDFTLFGPEIKVGTLPWSSV